MIKDIKTKKCAPKGQSIRSYHAQLTKILGDLIQMKQNGGFNCFLKLGNLNKNSWWKLFSPLSLVAASVIIPFVEDMEDLHWCIAFVALAIVAGGIQTIPESNTTGSFLYLWKHCLMNKKGWTQTTLSTQCQFGLFLHWLRCHFSWIIWNYNRGHAPYMSSWHFEVHHDHIFTKVHSQATWYHW